MLSKGEFTIALDRDKYPLYSLFGGEKGQVSGLAVNPGPDDERTYTRASGISGPDDTVLRHRTAGGGGYGNPLERDPDGVLDDALDEFIYFEPFLFEASPVSTLYLTLGALPKIEIVARTVLTMV